MNFFNNSEKISIKLIKISVALFLFFLMSLLIINDLGKPDTDFKELSTDSIQQINNESCSLSMLDLRMFGLTSPIKEDLIFQERILNIYPEVENIRCIGMVTEIVIDSSNRTVVFIGSSQILYFFLETIFFILIVSLLVFSNKDTYKSNILIYTIGYIIFYIIFEAGLNFERIFFPLDQDIFPLSGYFYNVVIISVLVIKLENKFLQTFYFIYFLFMFNEYFGLFIIIYFVNIIYNEKSKDNLHNQNVINFSIIMFYILRIISGVFSSPFNFSIELNKLWTLPTQRVWTGSSRYFDMYYNFASFKNNYYQKNGMVCTLDCNFTLKGGPVSNLISFNSNAKQVAIYIGTITLIMFIFLIIKIMKNSPKEQFLIACLLVSPAVNFLTFTMNDDLIIGLLIYFLFNNKNRAINKIKKILLFPIALFQVWPGIVYFAQLYVELIKKKYNAMVSTLTFIFAFLGINFYYFFVSENNFIFFEGRFYGFGYSSFSNLIEIITGLDRDIIYYPVVIISLLIAYINRSKISDRYYIESSPFINSEFHTLTILLFTGVMLFMGMIYSLPIHYFYLYFLYMYTNSNNLKFSIILFIFLTPSFSVIVPSSLTNFMSIMKDIASFYIFTISAGYMFNNFHNFLFSKKTKINTTNSKGG